MKKYVLPFLLLCSFLSEAATYYSKLGATNPALGASWTLNSDGTGGNATIAIIQNGIDDFVIQTGHTLTAININFKPKNLTIQPGGRLNMGTFMLNFASSSSILSLGGVLDVTANPSFSSITIDNLGGAGELRMGAGIGFFVLSSGTFKDVSTNKVTFFGTTNYTLPIGTYPTLQIEGNGVKTLTGPTLVNRDFLIATGGNFNGGANVLTITRYFENSGIFTAGTGTVAFAGITSEVQKIVNSTTFYNLTINNPGGQVIPNSTITVTNALTLTSGQLQIGNNNLNYSGTSANITGNGWVETNGTGVFSTNATGAFTFPVGNATNVQAIQFNNIPIGTTTTVRFGTSSTLPTASTGSWYVTNTVSNFSLGGGFTLKNPIGNHLTTSKIAYKQNSPNFWDPLATTRTGSDFSTTTSIPMVVGGTQIALYSCSPPAMSGATAVPIGGTAMFTGGGTPYPINPWSTTNDAVATVSATGVVAGKASGSAIITYMDNFTCTNSMTVTVAPTTQPLGNRGMYFDGVDDYVNAGTSISNTINSAISNNPFSISTWVKLSSLAGDHVLLTSWAEGNGASLFRFGVLNGQPYLKEVNGLYNTNGVLLEVNKWTHVTVTYDLSSLNWYHNGVLVATKGAANLYNGSGVPVRIGTDGVEFFRGQIDEMKVFNKVLSTAEVNTEMGSTALAASCVTYWNFEDDAGGLNAINVQDAVTGNKATPANGPLWVLRTTNTLDDGLQGSLRWAIAEANVDTDKDYIDFSIQQTDINAISVITPASTISITEPVYLDGYSAYGSKVNTAPFRSANNSELRVEFDASLANAGTAKGQAINLNTSNSILAGFAVHGGEYPIGIAGNNNSVKGCYSGLKADGSAGVINSFGWSIDGTGHTIGWSTTPDPAAANIFSNTDRYTLRVNASNSRISGNYFGTDKTGNTAISNSFN